ncbi:MAG: Holliday junction resolvase RuvX [Candidatus Sericytochromatia bacterium]|nr:Holliday junction resolvase RuvX [Candidatus Tanganyikabacteria bacterium]
MEEVARILGLDVGSRTIGVAVSDPLGLTAQGAGVIKRVSAAADVDEISRLANLYHAETIVVGYPVSLGGSIGPQARSVDAFIERLEAAGHRIEREDERFTTKIAQQVLIAADVSRAKRKQVIDQQAAILILQAYLDRKRRQERTP